MLDYVTTSRQQLTSVSRQYLDEKLPAADEAKDKLITRLQQVVLHTQKNKAYHQAINTLINIVKKYASKAQDALDETIDKSNISDEDEKVQQAGRDLRKFVENLAGKSMDGVIETSQKVSSLSGISALLQF